MRGALDEGEHVARGFDCEPVRRRSWPRQYLSRHFAHEFGLALRGLGEERDYQIFKGDQADADVAFFRVSDFTCDGS